MKAKKQIDNINKLGIKIDYHNFWVLNQLEKRLAIHFQC